MTEDRLRDVELSLMETRSRVDHLSSDIKTMAKYFDAIVTVSVKLEALEKTVTASSRDFEDKIKSANYIGLSILGLLIAALVKVVFFGGRI
jgi:hypothetical protein